MKLLTKIGFGVTLFWVSLMLVVVFLKWESTSTMGLNEWGDFLAGLSAPLALLWLVIGYFQQAEELRLNTSALHAQQEELSRQVKETAILAENSERQALASESLVTLTMENSQRAEEIRQIQAKPKLISGGSGGFSGGVQITIINAGSIVSEVSFDIDGIGEIPFSHAKIWKTNERGKLTFQRGKANLPKFPAELTIKYTTKYGQKNTDHYVMPTQNEIQKRDS